MVSSSISSLVTVKKRELKNLFSLKNYYKIVVPLSSKNDMS